MEVVGKLKKLLTGPDNVLRFWCPGCKASHAVNHGAADRWTWNGSYDKPTFSPSVLVRSGHYCSHWNPDDNCWCKYNAECVAAGEQPSSFNCTVCHSFVTDGRIQFLTDSTHELAGQTVDLPDWPEGE